MIIQKAPRRFMHRGRSMHRESISMHRGRSCITNQYPCIAEDPCIASQYSCIAKDLCIASQYPCIAEDHASRVNTPALREDIHASQKLRIVRRFHASRKIMHREKISCLTEIYSSQEDFMPCRNICIAGIY